MCGIAGTMRFDGQPVDRQALTYMIKAAHHRGPDDTDFLICGSDFDRLNARLKWSMFNLAVWGRDFSVSA